MGFTSSLGQEETWYASLIWPILKDKKNMCMVNTANSFKDKKNICMVNTANSAILHWFTLYSHIGMSSFSAEKLK